MNESIIDEIEKIDIIEDTKNIDTIDMVNDSILYYLFKTYIYDYLFYDTENVNINNLMNSNMDSNMDSNMNSKMNFNMNEKSKKFVKYISKLSDIELIDNELKSHDKISKLIGSENKFSRKEFLEIISETYENEVDYVKQFSLDFLRQTVYINGQLVKSCSELFLILSKYNRKINLDGKDYYTFNLILLLICQTTFYLSYLKIFNNLNEIKEKEKLNNNTCNTNTISFENLFLSHNGDLNDHKNDCIRIDIDENKLDGLFLSKYKIFDIETEETIYEIFSSITFSINDDNCYISQKLNEDDYVFV